MEPHLARPVLETPLFARLAASPARTGRLLAFVAGGVLLGTASGLTPGLHANTFALLLAGVAPALPGPTAAVGAAILAAGTVHTFLDVVPALAIGVPDPAMAASALPGHRLVLRGRGREALRLSALGSGGAVLLALALAAPVTAAMTRAYPVVSAHLPLVFAGVVAVLVLSERGLLARAGALGSVGASGGLGLLTLDLETTGLLDAGGVLTPLFAGLFGVPVLLDAVGGAGVPAQDDPRVTLSPRRVAWFVATGTLAGAGVGYLPGVSSAVAATVALVAMPAADAREFVVTTSGVNTANAVFTLFALVALGTPRSGVLVALTSTPGRPSLGVMVGSVALAAGAGFLLVLTVGDRYLRTVGDLDPTRLSLGVLALLVCIVLVLTGPVGVGVLAAAALVGHLPPLTGARRSTLMGVLLVPLAVR